MTCYYNSKATYRESYGHFRVEDIDAYLCDEVIYCYAGIDETTYQISVSGSSETAAIII